MTGVSVRDVSQRDRRVCLLTGAGGTLGSAFCRRFAGTYAIAAVYHHRLPGAPTQHDRIFDPLDPHAMRTGDDTAVHAFPADLSVAGDAERVVHEALARFGSIDLVVHAAAHAVWAPILGNGRLLASARRQFDISVVAALELATAVADRCWRGHEAENEARNRNVVHLSSSAGVYVYPGQGQAVYAASKAALNTLTCHMADELRPLGVRVNALAPDSFPHRVSLDAVLDRIRALDESRVTGQIVVLEEAGETLV